MSDDQQQIKGFTFLPSFDKCFEAIRDNDALTLKFFHAIRDYWFRGVKPVFEGSEAFSWGQIEYLFEQAKETSKRRAEKKLGNKNALKPETTENNKNNTIQQKQPETTETTQNNKNNPFREEKRREETRKEEKSRDETNISTPKPPAKSKPRAKTYKTVADIKGAHPKAMAFWEAVRAVYPSHRRHAPADYTLCQIEQDGLCERQDEIIATIKRFVAEDDEWKRGFVPRMGNFFKNQLWQNDPTPPKPPEIREIQTIRTSKPAMPTFNIDPRETAI